MISRRDFLRISGMASAAALINWQCPVLTKARANEGYGVVVIGAGLGGLSCAALLARNGMKPLVIDKRDVPGGYATSFKRYGSGIDEPFLCEASLHGITGNPMGMALLTELFEMPPEQIQAAMLVPHQHSWSSVYPDFSLDIRQPWAGGGLENAYAMLVSKFPDEAEGLAQYMQCWSGLLVDIAKFYDPDDGGIPDDISDFPVIYPTWASMLWKKKKEKTKTLTDLFKEYKIKNPQLQAILGQSWSYYGLPPSEIPAWLYLMGTGFYHAYGNFYIKGSSQSLSDALQDTIEAYGGKVMLNTEVTEIILAPDPENPDKPRAVGVKTDNEDYPVCYAGAVVSNAAVPQTFSLISESAVMPSEYYAYLDRISSYKPSTSHFNVWLGVDLADGDDGFVESYKSLRSNTLVYPDYKPDQAYKGGMQCDPEKAVFAVIAYDKVGTVSPGGCASITISMPCGYTPWEKFEAVYRNSYGGSEIVRGNMTIEDYYAEKDRIAEILIERANKQVLPGLLSPGRIKMIEKSSPLTNVRFTNNSRGAIYGYDQTEDNSGLSRLGNRTPIRGLYLASAWSNPGGGFEFVMLSGKEAVKCIAEDMG